MEKESQEVKPPGFLATALAFLIASAPVFGSQPLKLQLPTDNTALFGDSPQKFYMYTNRTFEGVSSTPWQAGQYGFVRNMVRTPEGIIGSKFHEGVDIRPVKRDSSGRPLDEVRSIGTGVVAYTCPTSSRSNYGKYVVIEHNWGDGPMFSLYAHLAEISVAPGQRVLQGSKIGKMGYTGAGLNRTRAHLHLELGFLLSLRFEDWHHAFLGGTNHHGIHNGLNLSGLDIAGLYKELRKTPRISIPEFVRRTPVYYKVACARKGPLEIVERYPWLKKGDHTQPSPCWEIAFTASGLPLSVAPSHRVVSRPTVTYVRTTRAKHEYFTIKRLVGTGRRASLSASGLRYLKLIAGDFPAQAPQEN